MSPQLDELSEWDSIGEWIENLQTVNITSQKVVSASHKLLLVDDEQKILDSLTRLLFEEDYEVETNAFLNLNEDDK